MTSSYRELKFDSWTDLQSYLLKNEKKFASWLFRGQSDASWDLKPSLERVCKDKFEKPWNLIPVIEENLLREFKRHFHRYSRYIPEESDTIEWLAFMQHHGAPTRLLDWTYSFYVAAFFAVEQARPKTPCAIWVLDHRWCWECVRRKMPADVIKQIDNDPRWGKSPDVHQAILDNSIPLVVTCNSFFQNERHSVQQGIFTAPLDLKKPFMKNIEFLDNPTNIKKHFLKLILDFNVKSIGLSLSSLNMMNINRKSLFPGLDGFAKNLENMVAGKLGVKQRRSGILPP